MFKIISHSLELNRSTHLVSGRIANMMSEFRRHSAKPDITKEALASYYEKIRKFFPATESSNGILLESTSSHNKTALMHVAEKAILASALILIKKDKKPQTKNIKKERQLKQYRENLLAKFKFLIVIGCKAKLRVIVNLQIRGSFYFDCFGFVSRPRSR